MQTRPLLYILSVFLFLSCGKTYKLSNSDLSFNPYKAGDTLIFQLNDSLIDTVFIRNISGQTVRFNPMMDDKKGRWQGLSVLVDHVAANNDSLPGRSKGSIMGINNYGNGTILDYWFTGYDKGEAISKPFDMKDLDTVRTTEYAGKAGLFNDVIVLRSDTVYPASFDALSKIYWSKRHGYVRMEVNKKHVWELIKYLSKEK